MKVKALLLAILACFSVFSMAEKVTVVLDWYPNTNHTGLYVALENGYFEDEGLEVSIVQPSKLTAEQLVGSGRAEFGVSFQEFVTYARAEGIPIVSIAAVIQHNTSGFAWLRSSGIRSPVDWEGKTYGSWGTEIEEAILKTVCKRYGVDWTRVKKVTVGQVDFATGLRQGIFDFQWIYYGWEGIGAKLKGLDIEFLPMNQIDPVFDYYSPVFITSERLISESPELVRRFLRAVSRGYIYAITHPEESAKILLKYAPELDEKLVYESQKYLSRHYVEDAPKWGWQDENVWRRFYQWMKENNLVPQMDITKAFTNEYLP
ncbi:MAG: NitT/TauT family transport system substrate-binding protein [Thermotogota bacterium]|nr:NitT/TauT family transport system substrate-binding protein [Thermotogota bacterium]MDK2865041.1 NitT/TauT family transport system substrate-binding protein [Thermotogota bacterium]